MSKAKNAIAKQKGFSYILACVLLIFVMLLVAVSVQYVTVYHIARTQKNEMQLRIDGYLTRYAMEEYDSLKQGEAWGQYLDRDALTEGVYDLLHNESDSYVMIQSGVSELTGDRFGVMVDYVISIPFELFNRKIADIYVPVTIVSRYQPITGGE